MQSIAALIRAGVDPDLVAQVAADLVDAAARRNEKRAMTPAERQAAKRARDKANVTENVTLSSEVSRNDVTSVTVEQERPHTPKESSPLPSDPKGSSVSPPAGGSSSERSASAAEAKRLLGTVLGEATVRDVIAHRKALRAPLTLTAAKGLLKAFVASGDPEAAAQTMMTNGWRGYNAEWGTQARAGPARRQPGMTLSEMAHMDEPGFFNDPRIDPCNGTAQGATAGDQVANGFAGRVSVSDRDDGWDKLVDHERT